MTETKVLNAGDVGALDAFLEARIERFTPPWSTAAGSLSRVNT
jgi:hypothetical protein